jgi:hypothetical protein
MNPKLRIALSWIARLVIFGAGTFYILARVEVVLVLEGLFGYPWGPCDGVVAQHRNDYIIWTSLILGLSVLPYWCTDRFLQKTKKPVFLFIVFFQLLVFVAGGVYYVTTVSSWCNEQQEELKKELEKPVYKEK